MRLKMKVGDVYDFGGPLAAFQTVHDAGMARSFRVYGRYTAEVE
jgi:hypothetical protein